MALLGLVAVAGYQNRGRISEMLADARQAAPVAGSDPQATSGANGGCFLSEIGNLFGAGAASGTLSSGLGDLISRFKDSGRQAAAESWVSNQANMPVNVDELETVLGGETLDELSQRTGLSRQELLLRLNAALPDVVNRFTPDGHVPDAAGARRFD